MRPLALSLVVLAALAPATAHAAESAFPTPQASAYGMEWAAYIDPADLPPAGERAVVCLVDAGVGIDPDLPADRPEGPVIERISLDGGSGLDGPSWENRHGTGLAALAGAVPGNDFGIAGVWPAVRILSVRAMAYDERVFSNDAYRRGISACRSAAEVRGVPVAAINLSLGCGGCVLPDAERERVEDAIGRAHDSGISVLGAAGNVAGPLQVPASIPGVLAVAAGDTDEGALCPGASYGPDVLVGPGCGVVVGVDGVPAMSDTAGSSAATVVASTVVALLHTLRPEASRADVERWLREGAHVVEGRPLLHGEGAARAAGLDGVVQRAKARMPATVHAVAPGPPPAPAPPAVEPPTAAAPPGAPPVTADRWELPRPRATVRWLRGRLVVALRRPPAGAVGVALTAGRTTRRLAATPPRTVRIRLARRPGRVVLRHLAAPGGQYVASEPLVLRAQRGGRYR